MASVPVEEYLHTAYEPDCDFIDGDYWSGMLANTFMASCRDFFMRYFSVARDSAVFAYS